MDKNKLKEAILDMCMQFSFDQSENKSIMQHTDKLYSLMADVSVKFSEWKNKVDWDIDCNLIDNEDILNCENDSQLFSYFISNIYNQ